MLRKAIYLLIHPRVKLLIGIFLLYILWNKLNREGTEFLVALLPEFGSAAILSFLFWLERTVQLQQAVQQAREEMSSKLRSSTANIASAGHQVLLEAEPKSDVDWLLEKGLISGRQALLWRQLERDGSIQKAIESIGTAR